MRRRCSALMLAPCLCVLLVVIMMLTLLSGNVTSFHKRAGAILQQASADVLCLQEARVSQSGAMKADATARRHGWNLELGKVVPVRSVQARSRANRTMRKVRCTPFQASDATYVATLSKHPLHSCGTACLETRLLRESGRWTRHAISLSKFATNRSQRHEWFHVVNFYGISHPSNAIQATEKRRLFFSVFEEASRLGDVPVAVCTDANYICDHRAVKDLLATEQWLDAAALFAGPDGPEHTFSQNAKWDGYSRQGSSRIDYVFLNRAARQACVECTVRRDFAIKNHLFLQVRFDLRVLRQTYLTRILPKPYPLENVPPLTEDVKTFLAEEAIRQTGFNMTSLRDSSPDAKWRAFGRVLDKYLICGARLLRPMPGVVAA